MLSRAAVAFVAADGGDELAWYLTNDELAWYSPTMSWPGTHQR
jgi:hypothetical protein